MSSRSPSQRTPLAPPILVTSDEDLRALLGAICDEPYVAVDTESNSLYVYRERVCLIQISIPSADYVVDPLADIDLEPLARLFADPKVQKIFHAAEYDVMCLRRDYDFEFANLFDTMWAARILGWSRIGLADVLKELFDVRTNKRYQRYNWGKRPLPSKALIYAGIDTHYLLPLCHLQTDGLLRKKRWEEAKDVFDRLCTAESVTNGFVPEDFWQVKGVFDLTGRQRAILRELCIWRDKEARRRDLPHFKILHDRVLTTLARARPFTKDELLYVEGMKQYHVRRYGRGVLQAIDRGIRAPRPAPPPPPRRHSEVEIERFEALRTWRKQVAAEREVDVDVIVGNAVLWELAETPPHTLEELDGVDGLGTWKQSAYGEAILRVLAD